MKNQKSLNDKSIDILQTLDIEENCFGIYWKNKFIFDNFQEVVSENNIAWKHSSVFDDRDYTYLSLFLKGRDLSSYSDSPAMLQACEDLLEAQKKAALTAKIDFSQMCFFDILPDHLMNKWFSLRESAMKNVLKKVEKPSDYAILHKIHVLASSISKQKIKVNDSPETIKYDIFASATGRLTTTRGSYPILNISKEERVQIQPKNDMFLELDINGAEIRTLLALSGKAQPNYDIHEYNKIEALIDVQTRKEVKAKFFAWLYNPESRDPNLEALYNKKVYKKHYENGYITTPFGRRLEVDERRALNYLTQSTTSDIVLENAYKIMKLLESKDSFVAFTMHDSVVLDFSREDHSLVSEIKDTFERNMFGRFLSTVSIGKNFGEMRELKI